MKAVSAILLLLTLCQAAVLPAPRSSAKGSTIRRRSAVPRKLNDDMDTALEQAQHRNIVTIYRMASKQRKIEEILNKVKEFEDSLENLSDEVSRQLTRLSSLSLTNGRL